MSSHLAAALAIGVFSTCITVVVVCKVRERRKWQAFIDGMQSDLRMLSMMGKSVQREMARRKEKP